MALSPSYITTTIPAAGGKPAIPTTISTNVPVAPAGQSEAPAPGASTSQQSSASIPSGIVIPSNLPTEAPASSEGISADVTSGATTDAATPQSTSAPGNIANTGSSSSAPESNAASSNNTGLIAAVGVLGGLLLIALVVIVFLLFRRRRRSTYAEVAKDSSADREVTQIGATTNKKSGNITATEVEASLFANAGHGQLVIDDKSVNSRFNQINHDINEWVLTHFRNMSPRPQSTSQEVLQGIRKQPHHKALLQDSRGRFLVLRGIVGDGLTDAFETGEINGLNDVYAMASRFPSNMPAREKAQWRASTVALLAKEPSFHEIQARAVEAVAQRIHYVASSIAGVEYSEPRLRQLTGIVQTAAALAIDLARQRMDFVLTHPSETEFDPQIMDDVLQESSADQLRDRRVLSVVFPAVIRYGDESGQGFDGRHVISKALVLVAGNEHAI